MKKHFLAFSLFAVVIAAFLVGCGSDTVVSLCDDTLHVGEDTGHHTIPVVNLALTDTIDVTAGAASDGKVSIFDHRLNANFVGDLKTGDCNKVTLETITSPDFVISDSSHVTNLEANGTAVINGDVITTSIVVKKGVMHTTSVSIIALDGFNFASVPGLFVIPGVFKKK